jgi:hypothetical protein
MWLRVVKPSVCGTALVFSFSISLFNILGGVAGLAWRDNWRRRGAGSDDVRLRVSRSFLVQAPPPLTNGNARQPGFAARGGAGIFAFGGSFARGAYLLPFAALAPTTVMRASALRSVRACANCSDKRTGQTCGALCCPRMRQLFCCPRCVRGRPHRFDLAVVPSLAGLRFIALPASHSYR